MTNGPQRDLETSHRIKQIVFLTRVRSDKHGEREWRLSSKLRMIYIRTYVYIYIYYTSEIKLGLQRRACQLNLDILSPILRNALYNCHYSRVIPCAVTVIRSIPAVPLYCNYSNILNCDEIKSASMNYLSQSECRAGVFL